MKQFVNSLGISLVGVIFSAMAFAQEGAVPAKQAPAKPAPMKSVVAEPEANTQNYANIKKGNWSLGGGLEFDVTGVENRDTVSTFALTPKIIYFVQDFIGVGGTMRLYTSSGMTSIGTGPLATYYFWQYDRFTANVSQDLILDAVSGSGRSSTAFQTDTSIGAQYFITPDVAGGPTLEFTHLFGNSDFSTVNRLSFRVELAVYL